MATAHQPPAPWTLDLQRPGPAPWHPQHQRATARSRRPRGAPPDWNVHLDLRSADRVTACRSEDSGLRPDRQGATLVASAIGSFASSAARPSSRLAPSSGSTTAWTWLAPAVSG